MSCQARRFRPIMSLGGLIIPLFRCLNSVRLLMPTNMAAVSSSYPSTFGLRFRGILANSICECQQNTKNNMRYFCPGT
jgi:hypothetical protein